MRRLTVFLIVTLILVVMVVPIYADDDDDEGGRRRRAQDVEFDFAGVMTSLGDVTFKPAPPPDHKRAVVRGVTAEGSVSGHFNGSFNYDEDILISYPREGFINRSDVTISTGDGDIRMRFGGRGTIKFAPDNPYIPILVEVENQPWTIRSGTGAYEGIRGAGRRSTVHDGCSSGFCLHFQGKIWFRGGRGGDD